MAKAPVSRSRAPSANPQSFMSKAYDDFAMDLGFKAADAGYDARLPARKASVKKSSNTGGSGFRGAKTIAAAENVTDFQKSQAMQYLGGVDSLEGVEAKVGRRDGEHYLYVDGKEVQRFDGAAVEDARKAASIINSMSADASKKEEKEEEKIDETAEKVDETKKLITKNLDLDAVDDTDESKAATEKVNDEFTDAAIANENAFGGDDVFDVVQDDSSFISPELKALQEKVAALQAELDAKSVTAENESGGASSIINQPGSNLSANNSGDALGVVSASSQNLNSGTAKGGVMEAAAAGPTSSGASEDKAIEMYKKGRRSTILTTAGGLLNDDKDAEQEGTLRRRRGLIA